MRLQQSSSNINTTNSMAASQQRLTLFSIVLAFSSFCVYLQFVASSKTTLSPSEIMEFMGQEEESQSDRKWQQPSSTSVDLSFLDDFRIAKRNATQLQDEEEAPMKQVYKSCLDNFQPLSGPVVDSYAQMSALEQRQIAEQFWQHQEGKLWMQHVRKGGGTNLCMLLRLNQHGLVKTTAQQWEMPPRETCQILDFCEDCDLTKRGPRSPSGRFQGWQTVPRLIDCVTGANHRNFMEFEKTVSPPDLLTNPEWANFVFISTLRHPVARIISALHNDQPYVSLKHGCPEPKPSNRWELNGCAHKAIATEATILEKCGQSTYHCYSNYYVRLFAGHYQGGQPVTEQTLEVAKRNFMRYSCVVLQEDWDSTAKCLQTKLSLPLRSNSKFNVAGIKEINSGGATNATQTTQSTSASSRNLSLLLSNSTFLQSLDSNELDRIWNLNHWDLEFYHWAKQIIQDGYFIN